MGSDRRQTENIDEAKLKVGSPKTRAVGVPAVVHALELSFKHMGAFRSAKTLLNVNQRDGFDCPGCAWPEGDKRSHAEFCENGAKAVAEEATRYKVTADFFERYSLDELRDFDDYSLGQQGRLMQPMLLDAGATHYRPASWDEAFGVIAEEMGALKDPDEAVFYTSGRTSNEAAFLYQLFVRGFGTNNLPDCSNMCHESSGAALNETIGVGKGTVSLIDVETAELLIVAGQNPGTNHPRMLSALEKAKRNGAIIIAVNPLPEAGLLRFENPQHARGIIGDGTPIADEFLQIKLGGDQALFQGFGKVLVEAERAGGPGSVFDLEFIRSSTGGLDAYLAELERTSWDDIVEGSGIDEATIRRIGALLVESSSTIVCWAMGLTQHKHSVATLRDVVNVLLLQGNMGRPGAGVCPVRGHSNVQGDRTMGISEKMPESFHDALDAEFSFASPRKHGFDTVEAIRAMRDGRAKVFIGMGGNFAKATPDTEVTEAALASMALTVQISTKLNRSHVVTGRRALILPTLGRTDRDEQASGRQRVTVEDSMSAVHASSGKLQPTSPEMRSEVAIVVGMATRVLAGRPNTPQVDWTGMQADYARVRTHIEHVIPGFDDFERRLNEDGGFVLAQGPRDERTFPTTTGVANFTANPLEYPRVPEGRLLLQTLRAHDQYNTTVYSVDDRYRGVYNGRRVLLINAADLDAFGYADGDHVDLVSEAADGVERRAVGFRLVAYSTPRGCVAAYYPETNVLVPLDSVADRSNTPTSKSVVIRLEPVSVPVEAIPSTG